MTIERRISTDHGSVSLQQSGETNAPGEHGHAARKISVYQLQISGGSISSVYGQLDELMLRALVEVGAGILGDPKPVIEEPERPIYLPDGSVAGATETGSPTPEHTLFQRTARRVWLQKRLRDYGVAWAPREDGGLYLDHDDMNAKVLKYDGEIFHWIIADNDAQENEGEPEHMQWGVYQGLVVGLTEGMIEASETLVQILDARAADANKRLGGEE